MAQNQPGPRAISALLSDVAQMFLHCGRPHKQHVVFLCNVLVHVRLEGREAIQHCAETIAGAFGRREIPGERAQKAKGPPRAIMFLLQGADRILDAAAVE